MKFINLKILKYFRHYLENQQNSKNFKSINYFLKIYNKLYNNTLKNSKIDEYKIL